jgi:hypothetical protein
VVDRDLANYCFADTSESVGVIGSAVDFDALFSAMWLPLRAPARENLPVVLRLMEAMNGLAPLTGLPDRCRRIRAFVDGRSATRTLNWTVQRSAHVPCGERLQPIRETPAGRISRTC